MTATYTLPRPGEAAHGARETACTAQVDAKAALSYRDLMVSDHAGQRAWLVPCRLVPDDDPAVTPEPAVSAAGGDRS